MKKNKSSADLPSACIDVALRTIFPTFSKKIGAKGIFYVQFSRSRNFSTNSPVDQRLVQIDQSARSTFVSRRSYHQRNKNLRLSLSLRFNFSFGDNEVTSWRILTMTNIFLYFSIICVLSDPICLGKMLSRAKKSSAKRFI